MFFFSKKYFIADLLEGLTDMHCHILPGIDDGSKHNEMSLEMINHYRNLGYKGLIATPHIMEGFYENTAEGIKKSLSALSAFLHEQGEGDFPISPAAEYMIDGNFDQLVEKKEFLPITGNKVLVEMSFLQSSFRIFEQLFTFQQNGFQPILAHPERYPYLKDLSEILEYKTRGCYLQLNLLSLGGHYGKLAAKQAFALLEGNHYDFLGTDVHHPGHFEVLKRITLSKKQLSLFEHLVSKTNGHLT